MGTKQFNNYEDLLTFTRASKGHALRPVSYGSELVTNGGFSTNSGWTKSSGATISGGNLNISVTAGGYEYAYQLEEFKVGAIYVLTATVNGTSGFNMRFRAGGDNSGLGVNDGRVAMTGSDQQVKKVFQATGTADRINIERDSQGDYSFTVDNVSLKEVTFDESGSTLTLFEHPNNVPRVEYDADGNRLGLLVEEARTNLISTSDASGWVVSGSGIKTINTQFTLGAFTGAIKASGGGDWNRIRTGYVTVTSGTTYTLTLFYKYGTSNNVLINFRDVSSASESRIVGAWGSLTNSLANAGTVTILEETSLPNDVKKVVIKYVPDFSGNFEFGVGPNSTTSGETVIALAAQLEQASIGTSYIKTTGSTATRSADVPSIPTAEFGYNSAEGTVVCEFSFKYEDGGSGFPRPWEIGNTSNVSERINVFVSESTGALVSSVITNNATQGNLTLKTGLSGSVDTTVAFAWARDSLGASDDGDTAVTDTDADILPTGTKRNLLALKQTNATNANINGHIKYIKYYPRRLTNAQLEDLSS